MRQLLKILAATALLYGCSTEENVITDQRAAFVKYFENNNIAYTVHSGVYRHIYNANREDYLEDKQLLYGDSVKFDYAISAFGNPFGTLYYTNVASLVGQDTVLNPEYWNFAPLGIRLGDTKLIRGLEVGLAGCRENDSVWLFMPSDVAYGDKGTGAIDGNTATAWAVKINKVTKNE